MAIEVAHVPAQVHLELLAVFLHLHLAIELVLGELLLDVDQPLDIYDVHIVQVGDSVDLLNQTGLLLAEIQLLFLFQNVEEITQFDYTFLSFDGLSVEAFDEPGPVLRIPVDQFLIYVAEQFLYFVLVLSQVG